MRIVKTVITSGLFLIAMPAMAEEKPKLDRNDPNATRCKRLSVIGSLVRKERICRTNAEWRAIGDQQNRDADDIITRNRAGMNPNE
jgi:hypothetical protein